MDGRMADTPLLETLSNVGASGCYYQGQPKKGRQEPTRAGLLDEISGMA